MKSRPSCDAICRLSLCVNYAILASLLAYPALGKEEKSDDWFDQDRRQEISEEEEEESYLNLDGRRKSPRAILNSLNKRLEATPETDLSKRISLLEQAVSSAPKLTASHKSELESLRSLKAEILSNLSKGSLGTLFIGDLQDSLNSLEPQADYILGDPNLSIALLDSSLVSGLNRKIRIEGRNGKFDEIDQIRATVQASPLNRVLGPQIEASVKSAYTTIVARRWDATTKEIPSLTAEPYLFGRLVQDPKRALNVQLDFPKGSDLRLQRNILRSLDRTWSKRYNLDFSTNAARLNDLTFKVGLKEIKEDRSERATTLESEIPGEVIEAANPEFMELAAKYEKAAESYKNALESYEDHYEMYLESLKDDTYDNAQAELRQAESTLENTPVGAGPDGPSDQYLAAQAALEVAESVANSITPATLPEPIPPKPTHHEILDELYLVPSTLVLSKSSTPYEYKAKLIEYTFSSQAKVQLSSNADSSLSESGSISLSHKRDWTDNEGHHRNDLTVEPGTFNQSSFESALNLFGLAFGTEVAKEFGSLLDKTDKQLPAKIENRQTLNLFLLRLALNGADQAENKYSLDNDELESLAKLAQDNSADPKSFRIACLKYLIEKSGLSNRVTERELQAIL
ncbi:MAG: hypothetical protein AAGB46_15940 [Verrucomicrobiota bacterium]